jgi:serine/threonine protein kinase
MLQPSRRRLEAVIRDPSGRQIARCLLRRGRYVIGQERKCEIVVDEPSVSSRHARLTVVTDEEFLLEDLQSANGVVVNGRSITGETPIDLDSMIHLGLCTLEFQRAGLPAGVFRHLPDGFLREMRYTLGNVIVEGGKSTIYEAYDASLGRDIAIKVMRPEAQARADQVLSFIREAQITSQLQHPGILPIYELGLNEAGQLNYTTRFIEGDSLHSILKSIAAGDPNTLSRFSLMSLMTVFQKVCETVAFAHAHGVVHCGLRPEAITIGTFGEVFVVNWGSARVHIVDDLGNAVSRPVCAAPGNILPPVCAYTAPEVAEEKFDDMTARSDIYSLGAILYRILALRAPLEVTSEEDTVRRILEEKITPASALQIGPLPHCPGGRIPEPLSVFAMKAMHRDPESRYPTVRKLQQHLAVWQSRLSHASSKVTAAPAAVAVARHS